MTIFCYRVGSSCRNGIFTGWNICNYILYELGKTCDKSCKYFFLFMFQIPKLKQNISIKAKLKKNKIIHQIRKLFQLRNKISFCYQAIIHMKIGKCYL